MSLTSILVASSGRSGTTALMALLASDPRIAFDRIYPFENRYLTYYAKFAALAGRRGTGLAEDAERLNDFDLNVLGVPTWPTDPPPDVRFLAPAPADLLRA